MSSKWRHCSFIFWVNTRKLDRLKTMGRLLGKKINAIWWNIKKNLQKLVGIRGYKFPTNLQNFTQKDLTEVKIFQKVLGGYFSKHSCTCARCFRASCHWIFREITEGHSRSLETTPLNTACVSPYYNVVTIPYRFWDIRCQKWHDLDSLNSG